MWVMGRLRLHQLVLCADIERFSGPSRTDAQRVVAHEGMYQALRVVFEACGIKLEECHHEDRGDGVLVLLPADVPKGRVVSRLPQEMVAALAAHNHVHALPAQVRLRVAVHAGEVLQDDHGVVGDAVNIAFRLLDAGALKDALSASSGLVAVIASETIYQDVIRHTPASSPETYRRIGVVVKETETTAWICLPDDRDILGQTTGAHSNASEQSTVDGTPAGPQEAPQVSLHARTDNTESGRSVSGNTFTGPTVFQVGDHNQQGNHFGT
jgi:hypothetical protein